MWIPHQISPLSFLLPGPPDTSHNYACTPLLNHLHTACMEKGELGDWGGGGNHKSAPLWLPSMGKYNMQILLVVKPHKYQIILFHLFNDRSNKLNIMASWTAWHTQSPANYCNMHVHVICTCTCTCMHIHITCTVQRSYIHSLPFYNIRLI